MSKKEKMKQNFITTTIILFFTFSIAYGQISTRMPIEISKAYRDGTRSTSGKPGLNYWQNSANYIISALLDAKNSRLTGSEQITYFNNSTDTLRTMVIRLYPDFFKKGNARSWSMGNFDLTDGTILNKIKIDGNTYSEKPGGRANRSTTNLFINLTKSINPGDSANVEIDWEMEIPTKRQVRMGNYGDNRFFVAYWYPQIAVYDDIDGWDKIPYLGTVEYYNDFNNYDVTIETPANFTVWATGVLTNMDNLYSKSVINNYNKAAVSDDIINIFSVNDCMSGKVLKHKGKNSWNFIATHVPDFTFAATTQSNWDATSTIANDKTGDRVIVDAVYPDSVDSFDKAALIAKKSVRFMIDSLPGWPYPYPHITSFCNGNKSGGMESPMMVNEGDPKNMASATGLIFHEILHTYFPFYMGTNERKYAWMDEGWATWLPYGIMNETNPDYHYFERITNSFKEFSGKEKETPLIYLSYNINDYQAYREHSYNRSAMAYAFLRQALGDSIFKTALHEYMYQWNGKHPMPYDFFNTFENATKQDLDWYFIPWFFNRDMADLGIKKVTLDNKIVIENNGGLPLPVAVSVQYYDGSYDSFFRNVSTWKTGNSAIIIVADPEKKITTVSLGNNNIPDAIPENNKFIFTE